MERLPETCSEILATLPLFAGYDLEAPEMEAVAAHLERCEECRDACGRARRAREVLGSLREPEASRETGPDLWAGVRSRMVSEGLLETGPRVVRPFASARWWVGSAAAAALVATVAFLGGPGGSGGSDGSGPVAPSAAPEGIAAVTPGPGGPGAPGAPRAPRASDETNSSAPSRGDSPQGGAVARPMVGELVGQGGMNLGTSPADGAPMAPEGSAGRALRRLEPGEQGLYEQALRESARMVPVHVGNGGRPKRLFGVR